MNREIRISGNSLVMGVLLAGLMLGVSCKKKEKRSQPVTAPSIPSGPTMGRNGDALRYSTVAEDTDGGSVAVRFDWGDGTISGWSALVPSGDSVLMTHAWQSLGTYSIRAQARDTNETTSVWTDRHQLTIPSICATFGGTADDEGRSVRQTSDGGYVISGYTKSYGAGGADVWLIKTDSSGNEVWNRTFGGPGDDSGNSVEQTSDGGYIIVGSTTSYGAGGADVWLIKTDADGNKIWDKTFGGPGDDFGNSVQQTSDGGYIIAGTTESYGYSCGGIWLIRTDASGSEIWDQVFGAKSAGHRGKSVQPTFDGGYIVVGTVDNHGSDYSNVFLIKTAEQGWVTWYNFFGETGFDEGNSVLQTLDSGYVIAGTTSVGGGDAAWLVKTDSMGKKVWDVTYGGSGLAEGNSIQPTSDGGYIIAGTTRANLSDKDVLVIKTDASGNREWTGAFGGIGDDEGNSVQQTSDGGYVVVGSTTSYGAGGKDVWLIKVGANGN